MTVTLTIEHALIAMLTITLLLSEVRAWVIRSRIETLEDVLDAERARGEFWRDFDLKQKRQANDRE